MLGPFHHTPPPTNKNEEKVAWAVAWTVLILGASMMLLWVVLAP